MGRPKGSKNKTEIQISEGNFIPVKIIYYFEWVCPSCKKFNLQRYKNMYHVLGPEWSSIGVTCSKCKAHFNIEDDREGSELI